MSSLPEVPFFVLGSPRSGTTLLRFILSSHPRLYVTRETGFIPHLGVAADARLSQESVQDLLRTIGRLNRWWGEVDDLDRFYQGLPESTLDHVLDGLYRTKLVGQGAARWGDKTPGYALYVSRLNDIFPTAQFIHVIRDGRDAALSAQAKWGTNTWYMDNYYLLASWVRHVTSAQQSGSSLDPNRYLEVRYESLTAEPEPEIERICGFLGETFHPAMMNHTKLAARTIAPGGHVEVLEPISTASVQRWKTEMSAFEQKMADRIAGRTLLALGYELAEAGSWRLGEVARLLILASKYGVVSAARSVLSSTGLVTLNRGKRR
ncbi:sulfotransferase [Chloroflexota bacterium]